MQKLGASNLLGFGNLIGFIFPILDLLQLKNALIDFSERIRRAAETIDV
jgi:hypothetical protein